MTDHVPATGFATGSMMAGVRETAVTAAAAQATAAVQARYVMALQRPRNHDMVRSALMKECRRPTFAESARYALPRSQWDPETRTRKQVEITGLTIRFAEAALRCTTNVLIETTVVYEDDSKRIVRVSVTDLESNVTYPKDVTIQKTIERKFLKKGQVALGERTGSDGEKVFLVGCTDDELLMKENALVSKAIRTNGLRLISGDLLDECEDEIDRTLKTRDAKDPDATRKKLLDSFEGIGVSPAQLKEFLGHDTSALSPDEVKRLRGIFTSIRDGGTTWDDLMIDLADSRAAFGGGEPTQEDPAARLKIIDLIATLRMPLAPDDYAKAVANVGITGDMNAASFGQLNQLAAMLQAKKPTPAAPATETKPRETAAEFAARKAAQGGGT